VSLKYCASTARNSGTTLTMGPFAAWYDLGGRGAKKASISCASSRSVSDGRAARTALPPFVRLPVHAECFLSPPTLMIGAAHDTMNPDEMHEMSELVQRGRFLFCPNGSHLAMWDDQAVFMDGVIALIRDVHRGEL